MFDFIQREIISLDVKMPEWSIDNLINYSQNMPTSRVTAFRTPWLDKKFCFENFDSLN